MKPKREEFKYSKLTADPKRKAIANPRADMMGGYDQIYRVKEFDANECAKLRGKILVLDNQGYCHWLQDGKEEDSKTSSQNDFPEIPLNDSNIPVKHKKNSTEIIHKITLKQIQIGAQLPKGIHSTGKRSVNHSAEKGKLFPLGPPSLNDIKQGAVGDCYLLTSLLSVLNSEAFGPSWIINHMVDNGNNTVTVRFYDPNHKPVDITVEKSLRDDDGLFSELRGAKTTPKRAQGPLWVGILEKAFTIFACHSNYSILGKGEDPRISLSALTGEKGRVLHVKEVFEIEPDNIFNTALDLSMKLEEFKDYTNQTKLAKDLLNISEKKDILKGIKYIKIGNREKKAEAIDSNTIIINLDSKITTKSEINYLFSEFPLKHFFRDIQPDKLQKLEELLKGKEEISFQDPEFEEIIDIISTGCREPKELINDINLTQSKRNLKILEEQLPILLKHFNAQELEIWCNMLSTCENPALEFADLLTAHQDSRGPDKPQQVIRMHEAIALFLRIITNSGTKNLSGQEQEVLSKFVDFLEKSKCFPGKRGSAQYSLKQLMLYAEIEQALIDNKLVAFSSNNNVGRESDGKQAVTGEEKSKGLAGNHAYAALQCSDENGLLGCVIRNPWGYYGRDYNHSEGRIAAKEGQSGEFWLELNDVCKRFKEIAIMEAPMEQEADSKHIQSSSPVGLFGKRASPEPAPEAVAVLESPKI